MKRPALTKPAIAAGYSEFINLGPQNFEAVNQIGAPSRESESFGPLALVFSQATYGASSLPTKQRVRLLGGQSRKSL
jgi:hypothetical protein